MRASISRRNGEVRANGIEADFIDAAPRPEGGASIFSRVADPYDSGT
jgi:hypothetical protein